MDQTRADSSELYGIQMLRALAALGVVVHHTLEVSNGAIGRFSPDWLTTAGASGVDIFFVISGFIMLHVSFRTGRMPPGPGEFLFRRATRIYPFYWLCCLATLAISAMGFLAAHHYDAATITSSFLLLPGDKLIGVSWTLVYEVYFYLIFAVMLLWLSKTMAIAGTTLSIVLFYIVSYFLPSSQVATFLANPLPVEFCFGLGLAYAYSAVSGRRQSWSVAPAWSVVGLALLLAGPLFIAHPTTNGLPPLPRVAAWGVPAFVVVAGFLNVGKPRLRATRMSVLLGDGSYAIYLTHAFVMIAYGRLLKIAVISRMPQLPVVVIIVILAAVIGMAAHLLVEKPLLGIIRQLTHRQTGHASPA